MSKLESDFSKVAKNINEKIKEAAKAIEAANKLAKKAGLYGLINAHRTEYDLRRNNPGISPKELDELLNKQAEKCELIDVDALEYELDQAGWSTSSSYC